MMEDINAQPDRLEDWLPDHVVLSPINTKANFCGYGHVQDTRELAECVLKAANGWSTGSYRSMEELRAAGTSCGCGRFVCYDHTADVRIVVDTDMQQGPFPDWREIFAEHPLLPGPVRDWLLCGERTDEMLTWWVELLVVAGDEEAASLLQRLHTHPFLDDDIPF